MGGYPFGVKGDVTQKGVLGLVDALQQRFGHRGLEQPVCYDLSLLCCQPQHFGSVI